MAPARWAEHRLMLDYVRDLSRRQVPLKRAHRRFRTVRAFAHHLAPRSLLEATSDDRRTWASDTALDKVARGRRRADLADFYEWCRETGGLAPAPNGPPGAASPVVGATGDLPALPPASPAGPGVVPEAPLPEEEEEVPLARRVGVALVLSAAGILWMAAAAMPDRPAQQSRPATSTITAPPPTTASSTTTTTTTVRPPSEVSVMAVNASGVTGRAATVTQTLRAAGYAVVAPQSASRPQPASSVYWTPGYENEARVVGDSLGLPATAARPVPASLAAADLQGANVVVVVGPELSPPG